VHWACTWPPSGLRLARCTAIRCPANLFTQLFGLGFPVPRLIASCSNRRVPPPRLVARSEKQQQPSPSKYNIVIPPASVSCQFSNPQFRGLRYGFCCSPHRLPHRRRVCFCVSFSFSSFFFFLTPHCSLTCIDPAAPKPSIFLCVCRGAHSYSLLSRISIPVGERDGIARPRHALLPSSLQHLHGTSFPPWRRTRTATRSMRRGATRSAPSAPAPARELSVQP
jgi:hypothetical protein